VVADELIGSGRLYGAISDGTGGAGVGTSRRLAQVTHIRIRSRETFPCLLSQAPESRREAARLCVAVTLGEKQSARLRLTTLHAWRVGYGAFLSRDYVDSVRLAL
jgi:hypothetical protein